MFNWLKKHTVGLFLFCMTLAANIIGLSNARADAPDIASTQVAGHTPAEWVGGGITALGLIVGATLAFGFVMLILRKAKAAVKRT